MARILAAWLDPEVLSAGDGTDLLLEYMLAEQVANQKRTIEYGSPGR